MLWAHTPGVANAPRQVERTVQGLRRRVNALAVRALQAQDTDGPGEAGRVPDLIIVHEADCLKMAGLEQLRDLYDQSALGLIFIGMPGLEKRLARYAQLYSRVGFARQFRALSTEEMQVILAHKWAQLGLTLSEGDFTDAEAVAAIVRILRINEMLTVTKEVVEAARESLVIGPL